MVVDLRQFTDYCEMGASNEMEFKWRRFDEADHFFPMLPENSLWEWLKLRHAWSFLVGDVVDGLLVFLKKIVDTGFSLRILLYIQKKVELSKINVWICCHAMVLNLLFFVSNVPNEYFWARVEMFLWYNFWWRVDYPLTIFVNNNREISPNKCHSIH